MGVADPIEAGLVDRLARPGGNITGLTNILSVLSGKRLELLKETVPKLSRVAVLWDPRNPGSTSQWKESEICSKRTEAAALFHGRKQCRQIRERVRRGD
jgi:putative ABC transport system substrate-binding protein